MKQMMALYQHIASFFASLDTSPATKSKLTAILESIKLRSLLEIELAAIIDVGEPLVKATYKIEGDGFLIFDCFEVVATLFSLFEIGHFPNIKAISTRLANGNAAAKQQ